MDPVSVSRTGQKNEVTWVNVRGPQSTHCMVCGGCELGLGGADVL